ncbi:permease [Boudabousia liubingyangii]|uniref:permease n=1 Tax=Boudabousia liubingyangii TaxID=1921764 RepID=UPI0009FB559E|nr:permease [Boudabousia liubingyangii]
MKTPLKNHSVKHQNAVFSRSSLVAIALILGLAALLWLRRLTGPLWVAEGRLQAWQVLFLSIVLQALPFLVLGSIISGLLAAFLPTGWAQRWFNTRPLWGVPIAAASGFALPACECASVPVASSLMRKGASPAAALTFLLAAPAVNPVVIVSTAVAFRNYPIMVWARLGASFTAAVLIGWIWWWKGRNYPPKPSSSACELHQHEGGWTEFRQTFGHDFLQAGGFLVFGAAAAAALKVFIPRSLYLELSNWPILMILVMALLAVGLSLCSEADAFVAAAFTQVSPTAQLVFLTVGPMVDIKLIALQVGSFGARFAVRFMSLTFLVSTLVAALFGFICF